MIKGHIKRVVRACLLSYATVVYIMSLSGTLIFKGKMEKADKDKSCILAAYSQTQEFKDFKQNTQKTLDEEYRAGVIKEDEYQKKIKFLQEDEFIEEAIVKNNENKFSDKLNNANSQIETSSKRAFVSSITGATTGTILAGYLAYITYSDYCKAGKKKEDDIEIEIK